MSDEVKSGATPLEGDGKRILMILGTPWAKPMPRARATRAMGRPTEAGGNELRPAAARAMGLNGSCGSSAVDPRTK